MSESLWYTCKTYKRFWEDISAETLPTWTEKDRERMKLKKPVKFPNSTGRKQVDKTIQLQTNVALYEKRRIIWQ